MSRIARKIGEQLTKVQSFSRSPRAKHWSALRSELEIMEEIPGEVRSRVLHGPCKVDSNFVLDRVRWRWCLNYLTVVCAAHF